jgi:integral membrane protein
VNAALIRYRVMANIIGVFLIVLICIGVPLKYWTTTGTNPQQVGVFITTVIGIAHGFLYMIFLVVAADLARRARFPLVFAALTLVLGTIPFLSFVGEHNATKRVKGQLTAGVDESADLPASSAS